MRAILGELDPDRAAQFGAKSAPPPTSPRSGWIGIIIMGDSALTTPTDELAQASSSQMVWSTRAIDWSPFLASRGWEEAPESCFSHVEAATDCGVREGMVVELPMAQGSNTIYWLAVIDQIFGPLLKLSLVGDERKSEYWKDLYQDQLYPLGWCQMNKITLTAPEKIQSICAKWSTLAIQYLEDITIDTISMHFIDGEGVTNVDRMRVGMAVDVRQDSAPEHFWPAHVLANHGGLLTLRAFGTQHTWREFYLSDRFFPFKHALTDSRLTYLKPDDLPLLEEHFNLDSRLTDGHVRGIPSELFRPEIPLEKNMFECQSVLEFIPPNSSRIERALIEKKLGDHHFVISCFSCPTKKFIGHMNSPTIFPYGWSNGWPSVPCHQNSELEKGKTHCPRRLFPPKEEARASGFVIGHVLEVLREGEVSVAQIVDMKDNILALRSLGDTESAQLCLVPAKSHTLFPLGWSAMNELPLGVTPAVFAELDSPNSDGEGLLRDQGAGDDSKSPSAESKVSTTTPDVVADSEHALLKNSVVEDDANASWCPPIFFNYKCYSSSFLSRARLASLPQSIGPGSTRLVVREVLSRIIGSSHKSGSVLKRLECNKDQPRVGFEVMCLKGKSRVLQLKGDVEIPIRTNLVADFCRDICQSLGACKHLISLVRLDECPDKCQYRSKGEPVAPIEGKSKIEPRGRGRKRQLNVDHVQGEEGSPTSSESEELGTPGPSRSTSPDTHEEVHHGMKVPKSRKKEGDAVPPRNKIRTRGAKLPNYKLHMKIRPSKKEQQVIENEWRRKAMGLERVKGRDSSMDHDTRESTPEKDAPPPIRKITLSSNPELWTPRDTALFLHHTPDCSHLAPFMIEDDVDGLAFMMLSYSTVKDFWCLSMPTAIKLCQHIESVRLAHLEQFRGE